MPEQPTIKQQSDDAEVVATMDRALINQHCHRCGGLMIHDHCLDAKSDSGEVEVKVLRCCACGELIDPTILRNRLRITRQGLKPAVQSQINFADSQSQLYPISSMKPVLKTWSATVHRDAIRKSANSYSPLTHTEESLP